MSGMFEPKWWVSKDVTADPMGPLANQHANIQTAPRKHTAICQFFLSFDINDLINEMFDELTHKLPTYSVLKKPVVIFGSV